MKKEYTKPQADVTEVQPLSVIADSIGVGNGTTNEQNAPLFLGDDWE